MPDRPNWLHEVKYDGYRMLVIRDGDRVRLAVEGRLRLQQALSVDRRGARKRSQRQFVIDGEAVLLESHGISDFDGLHSGKYDEEVRLHAFDCYRAATRRGDGSPSPVHYAH